jgi:hypothetical protein
LGLSRDFYFRNPPSVIIREEPSIDALQASMPGFFPFAKILERRANTRSGKVVVRVEAGFMPTMCKHKARFYTDIN